MIKPLLTEEPKYSIYELIEHLSSAQVDVRGAVAGALCTTSWDLTYDGECMVVVQAITRLWNAFCDMTMLLMGCPAR
jgi:hypothetical protein